MLSEMRKAKTNHKAAISASILVCFSLLSGCQNGEEALSEALPPSAQLGTANNSQPQKPVASSGFTNLASTEDVAFSYPVGREDPFAPASALNYLPPPKFIRDGEDSGISRDQIAEETKELVVTGIVGSGAQSVAIVQNKSVTGAVSIGDMGGDSGDGGELLPDGWKVAAISARSGTVTLMKKGAKAVLTIGAR